MRPFVRLVALPRWLMGRCGECRAPRGYHDPDCPMLPPSQRAQASAGAEPAAPGRRVS